jgi:ligand-binding sensor domain-containing protein
VAPKKRPVLLAVLGVLALTIAAVGFVRWRTLRALTEAAEEAATEQHLRVFVRPYLPTLNTAFEWIDAPADLTSAAEFQGHLFLAGNSGITEYDGRGVRLRGYRVGRELPQSPVLQVTTGTLADSDGPELIAVTSREGVLAFDGRQFRRIWPENPEARAITTVLVSRSGRLILGTEKLGVLIYDGTRLTKLHSTLADQHVTALAGDDGDLWVGTRSNGVLHYRGGRTETFGVPQGMPDAQVYSIALSADRAFVGTAFGIAEFTEAKLSRTFAKGVFARSLLIRGKRLLVGTMDQGVLEVAAERTRAEIGRETSASPDEVRSFLATADAVYVIARDGLLLRSDAEWKRVLSNEESRLTDGNIAALSVDPEGRLWVGYFDRGLDLLAANARTHHVENSHVFCVNRIAHNQDGTVVATANGLVLFDAAGNQRQVLTKNDGLIANHVTDVVVRPDGGMVIATPAGLTFLDNTGPRSLYAFHGLVNNHVYALGRRERQILAGTLGGLSVLQDDNVRASFTTASSSLQHNWVTAIVPVGHDWFVGTYGAGVVRLDETGAFHGMDVASGAFEINPTAMIATDKHVLAGTLGRGVLMYDRAREKWRMIRDGLPSLNVTALAQGNGFVYVGTDNGLVRIPEQSLTE